MPLFRKSEAAPPQPSADQTPVASEEMIGIIVNRVTENLRPLLRQAEPQRAQQPQADDGEADDFTPEERQRAERLARRMASEAVGPYADVFNSSIPSLARDAVVSELSEGQKMIYKKYSHEVDHYVEMATQNAPALRGDKRIHERAIKLMMGDHLDEVERIAFEHMKEEDLPPAFARASSSAESSTPQVELSPMEKDALVYFQSRNRSGQNWTEESYKYYQSIKPGYLHEMVAEHKERNKKE